MTLPGDIRIDRLDGPAAHAAVPALAGILRDCVQGGASVSFLAPLTQERAEVFWEGVADSIGRGERALLVARDAEALYGTVQVVLSLPENQPHRGEIAKLLVHRRARTHGIGAALMQSAEGEAVAAGKTLLTLDTANAVAMRLYERLGWSRCGVIPGFALNPDGTLCDTTVYWKRIGPETRERSA